MEIFKDARFREATQVLRLIQKQYPSAIIAGGAIRDARLGCEIKDFDIFIHHRVPEKPVREGSHPFDDRKATNRTIITESDILDCIVPTINAYGSTKYVKGASGATDGTTDAVHGISTWLNHYDIIITQHPPVEHVNRFFDIGLCKAYFTGKSFHYTADFNKDKDNHTLTIVGERMTQADIDACMAKHVPNILSKYQGYRVVVADHLPVDLFSI